MLGLPPAFNLSHDQTLQFNSLLIAFLFGDSLLNHHSNIDWHSDCLFDQAACFVLSSMSICILKSNFYIRLATYAHTYRLLIFKELFNQPCLGLVVFESFCTVLRWVQKRDYEAFQTSCQVFILQTRQFISQLFPLVLRGLGCEEVRLWTHSAQRSSPIFKIVTIYLPLILNKPADRKN